MEQALNSTLTQTLPPTEILLIDDASGDGSLDLLRQLETVHAPHVKVISLPKNMGPGVARNAGWETATQPWLAFLDADDMWHPRKLEIQWAWLLAHPEVALCGHASKFLQGQMNIPIEESPAAIPLSMKKMLISNRLPTRSVMLRRDLPFRFRGKDVTEDYLLWLEVISAGYPAYRLEVPLAFSLHPDFSSGGYSGRLWVHEKRELSAIRELFKNDRLGIVIYILATAWSYVKFLRRLWLMRSATS